MTYTSKYAQDAMNKAVNGDKGKRVKTKSSKATRGYNLPSSPKELSQIKKRKISQSKKS